MENKDNLFNKQYIRVKDKIRKYKQIKMITDGEKQLVKSILELRDKLMSAFLNYSDDDLSTVDYKNSLSITFMSNSKKMISMDYFIETLINYRLFYESNFSHGKNSTYGRNPILQLLIEDLLESINSILSRKNWKDKSIYDQFRGDSNHVSKWNYIARNVDQLSVQSEMIILSLSCIDNINDASEVLSAVLQLAGDFFYVCVNTHKDFDEMQLGGYINNYNEELAVLNNFFIRHGLKHLTVFNPSRKNYLLILDTYKPNCHHYIGHGSRGKISTTEKDYLVFRTKSRVTSEDIASAYSANIGQFMFMNCCESMIISQELRDSCFENILGYNLKLDNKEAVYFASEFYSFMDSS